MGSQLTASGQSQNGNLSAFIKKLVQKFEPKQIYLFGKIMDFNTRDGCFINDSREETYHHFLLMVTESSTRIEHQVQDFSNHSYHPGKVTILVHGKDTIQEAIRANSRFFMTILNSGQLIYNEDGMLQPEGVPDYIPTQAAVKAQKHYNHRLPLANGFFASAKECLANQHYHLSAFMAHQVVEQCCIALIRVHLAYRCDIHNIYRQLSVCDSFSAAPSKLLLSGRKDDKRLMEIMVKSYSAARYRDDFNVGQTDAEQLVVRAFKFIKLTEVLCRQKIEKLASEAAEYKQVKKESEAAND